MKSTKRKIIILWLLGLLSIPMGLIPSQVMNYLTGILQPGAVNASFSVLPVVMLFFLSIVGVAVLDVIRTIIKGITMESIVRTKSIRLFDHVLKASPAFFRKNQTAKISNRIVGEIRKTESFLLDLKIGLPLAVLGLLVFSYVMFFGLSSSTPIIGRHLPSNFSQQGNWFLASLIILLSPVQAYFLLFDKKFQRIRRATAKADDEVAEISYETVNNVREIRNHYAFGYAIFRMDQVFNNLRKIEIDITKLQALFTGLGPVLDGVVKVILLAIGARLCVGDLKIPLIGITVAGIEWKDYMGFAGIAVVVNSYVGQLKNYVFNWRVSKESFRRIDEFRKADQLLDRDTQTLPVVGDKDSIEFNALDFETDDGIKILSDLNINIKPGEHIALVGPSGCGKSTTLHLILREINKSSGKLVFSDKDIERCDFEKLSHEVAFVQQKPVLLNTTLRNNILMGLRRDSAKTLLDGGAKVDISRLPACQNIEDLNQHLINVVDKVALRSDIARKALDNRLPKGYENSALIRRRNDIQQLVSEKIIKNDFDLLQKFDKEQYLCGSTIFENVLFGVLSPDEAGDQSNVKNSLKLLIPPVMQTPLGDLLLWLGKQQFIHDQNIALRIKHTSAALFEVLNSYKVVGEVKEELSSNISGIENNDTYALRALKPDLKKILIEIALSSNAGYAISFFKDADKFVGLVLKTREELTKESRLKDIHFERFDAKRPAAAISLREILLGGQVNTAIRNAFARIDQMIIETLEKQGLLNDLILIGLESPAGEEGRLLSGGQAMKVQIARVLLKNPNILLLDEATAALDEKSQARIVKVIEDDYKDKTVIMVSHRLSTIRNYSRILVFDRGHIVQQGTYDELVELPGLFQDLVRQERGEPPLATGQLTQETGAAEQQSATEIQRAISLSPIFADLRSEHIALLERMSHRVKCEKSTVLFERGDEGDEYFIILSGEVEFFIRKSEDNTLDIIDTYGRGQSFGELALFGEVSRTLGARAKTELHLCVINRDDLLKLIEINPEISLSLLKLVSRQVANLRSEKYYRI